MPVIIPAMGNGARLAAVAMLGLWLLSGPLAASEAPTAVRDLAQARAPINAVKARFRWFTEPSDGIGAARERRGELAAIRASADRRVRFSITSRTPEGDELRRWCSDGNSEFEIEQLVPEEQPVVRPLDPARQDLDFDRIVACVLLDLGPLERDFTMTLTADGDRRRLLLVPATAELRERLADITVILGGDEPREILIDDHKTTRIRLVIDGLESNPQIPDRYFSP